MKFNSIDDDVNARMVELLYYLQTQFYNDVKLLDFKNNPTARGKALLKQISKLGKANVINY